MLNIKKILLCLNAMVLMGCSAASDSKPAQKKLEITGKVRVADKLISRLSDSDTIFLIARPVQGGPPVAVKRWVGKNYPYPFTLTDADLMTPDSVLDQPLNLTVRVDKDGDAMTKNPGDLTGTYGKNPVALDAQDVEVFVDEELP